eukprot:UN31733
MRVCSNMKTIDFFIFIKKILGKNMYQYDSIVFQHLVANVLQICKQNKNQIEYFANTLVVKYILADHEIWGKTSPEMQSLVYGKLQSWCLEGPVLLQMAGNKEQELPTNKRMHKWNCKRLFELDIVSDLLSILLIPDLDDDTKNNVLQTIRH